MVVSNGVSLNNDMNTSLNTNVDFAAFSALEFFPQAIFCLNKSLKVMYTNSLAKEKISSHLVSISPCGTIHLNSANEDKKLTAVASRLAICDEKTHPCKICSERMIIRGIDSCYRTFTLSRESLDNSNFLLTIQNEFTINEANMRALGAAFLLTPTEQKILRMMVTGLKPKEIAYEMGISLNTVRSHLRTLYAKMQVNGYSDALSLGIQLLA